MVATHSLITRMVFAVAWTTCVLSLGAGCQSHMLVTPVVFDAQGRVRPFDHMAQHDRTPSFEVLYATDREPSGKSTPADYYTNARSSVVRLGKAVVRLGGPDMSWERLSELSQMKKRSADPAIDLTDIEEFGVLWTTVPDPQLDYMDKRVPEATHEPAARFAKTINARMATSERKQILIFVHGFDTEFGANLKLIGELWHYLGRDGIALSYAWPSEHDVLQYQADKANAAYSIRPFRLLLEFLASETDVEQINIFAHSAGSPVVVEALTLLRMMHADQDPAALQATARIGQVVLAAPDMELGQFVNCALDGFSQIAAHVTIYMSSTDKALSFAGRLFHDTRLGTALGHLTPWELQGLHDSARTSVIDVDPAQRVHHDWLGHSYYQRNPWISSDLLLTLKFGLTPPQRGCVRSADGALWTFPENYPERVQEIARELYRKN